MKGLLSVTLFLIGSVAQSLKLYSVHVPEYQLFGENVIFECEFEIHASKLYAVKWYKDDEEFFRFVPKFRPPIYIHQVDGVNVDVSESNIKKVVLKAVDLKSTGVYRCEVSLEAPSFLTEHGEGRMTVIYLPKGGPQITGNLQEEYSIGDILDLNCTSYLSYPPAILTWYINDLPIGSNWATQLYTQNETQHIPELYTKNSAVPKDSLISTTSHLKLTLSASHFRPNGIVRIRCTSSISTDFPWQETYEISFGNFSKKNRLMNLANQTTSYEHHHKYTKSDRNNNNKEHFIFNHHNHQNKHWYNGGSKIRHMPKPFIFNSTSFVTVRGCSLKISPDLIILTILCLWEHFLLLEPFGYL